MHPPSALLAAVVAALLGAGGGAAVVALAGEGRTATTTIAAGPGPAQARAAASTAASGALSARQVYDRARGSVAFVTAQGAQMTPARPEATGSGFVVSKQGLILNGSGSAQVGDVGIGFAIPSDTVGAFLTRLGAQPQAPS